MVLLPGWMSTRPPPVGRDTANGIPVDRSIGRSVDRSVARWIGRLATGYWLLATGYCTGYWLLAHQTGHLNGGRAVPPLATGTPNQSFGRAAYCLLPIAYCLMPIGYCLLLTAHCSLPAA
jgi:hypothetical protein